MKYHVVHTTRYEGSEPISVGHNEAWLTPRTTPTQRLSAHSLDIDPHPSIVSTRQDYFGNTVTQFSFNQGYRQLEVTATSDVDLHPLVLSAGVGPPWDEISAQVRRHASPDDLAAYEFLIDSPRCRARDEFAAYARSSFPPARSLVEGATDLMRRLHREFRFDSEATTVSTPVEQFFRQQRGVCQDFAHLMISMLRSLGLAARYVSGYLRTEPAGDATQLIGSSASHAWLSLYCGPLGWIDFDPTNDQLPALAHVTIAWGRDYGDVAPLRGVYIGGGKLRMSVSVEVVECKEDR